MLGARTRDRTVTQPTPQPADGDPDGDPAPRRRIFGLDALRGIAVFLMIEQHVGIWLWHGPNLAAGETYKDYPLPVGFNALGGMAAPLFVTLAGVGSALFVAAGRPRTDSTLVRRGLTLMGFGYLLNWLTPSWFSWGSWFVLHMMGFAMALAPVWRRLSTRTLLALCGAVLVGAVAAQEAFELPARLTNAQMRNVHLPGGPLRLALVGSQFPILPWLTFYLAGFVAGRWLDEGYLQRVARLGAGFLGLGVAGVALHGSGLLSGRVFTRALSVQLGFFPASISIVGLLLGGALLLITLVFWAEQRRSIGADNPLVTLGRISLTLLILHVWLFREASRRVFVSAERPTGLWHGLDAGAAVLIIFAFVILATFASRGWQRVNYRFGAEWLLRRIAG